MPARMNAHTHAHVRTQPSRAKTGSKQKNKHNTGTNINTNYIPTRSKKRSNKNISPASNISKAARKALARRPFQKLDESILALLDTSRINVSDSNISYQNMNTDMEGSLADTSRAGYADPA